MKSRQQEAGRGRFWDPENKIPCSALPFGELVAVDVNTGEIAWHVPLGFVESLKEKGLGTTGALNIGGIMATASGLISIGASTDRRFRAFKSETGELLWETELEAAAHSIPMTFSARTPAVRGDRGRRRELSRVAGGQPHHRVHAPEGTR